MEIKYTTSKFELVKATEGSAGFDLHAIEKQVIFPNETKLVKTGLKLELPIGTMALVLSRSGLALKNSVFVLNAPGLIDSDYRGEVCVILHNSGREPYEVLEGSRIAQLVIMDSKDITMIKSEEINKNTARGSGGFGSTGTGFIKYGSEVKS